MTAINRTPGEYARLSREQFYPAEVVAKIARDFGFNPEQLTYALDDVVASLDDAGHWQAHYPHWLTAKEKAKASLKALKLLRQEWVNAGPEVKATIAASFDDCSAEKMLVQINGIIDVMNLLVETKGRGRGNQGNGRKSQGVKISSFEGCVADLYRFWHKAKKGAPMGHEIRYSVRHHKRTASLGLQFTHACLSHLDNRISLETCQTLLRDVKKRAK